MSDGSNSDFPLVSVITVCFNAGKTIRRTIHSVLEQTYPNIEYLVVDGGSSDATLDILREHEGRLSFTTEPDRGMYDAMNKGIRRARGKWIHIVNADDWYASPDALARTVPQLAPDRTNYCDPHTCLSPPRAGAAIARSLPLDALHRGVFAAPDANCCA